MSRIDQLKGTERRLVVVRHEKDGGMSRGWVAMGMEFLRGVESVRNHVVMVVQPCEYTKCHWTVHFKHKLHIL